MIAPSAAFTRRVACADVSRVQVALLATLACLAAFHLAVLAYHLGSSLQFPYELNYGEGYVLNDAVRLARGEPIYVDLQEFPMIRSPYPPLFPWLWSLIVQVVGPVLWPGRALEVVGLVGIVALVALNAYRTRQGIWPMLAACSLVAASPFIYQWAAFARVDLLALFFAVGGVLAAQWVRGRRGVVLAAVLCGLGMWTKQTTITAAIAAALALGLRDWRSGALFVLVVAAPSLAAAGVLDRATGGEFVRHVVLGNATNPALPARAAVYLATFICLHLIVLSAGVWWLRRALLGRPSPLAIYLPISLLAGLSAGNDGSSVNYLIEPVVALTLVVPFVWRAVAPTSWLAAPLFSVLQLVLLAHWPNAFGTNYLAEGALGRTPTAADAVIGERLDGVIRAAPGWVISEPASYAVRNSRPVYVQPIDLRAEEFQGRWRAQPLVDALSGGQFSTVITSYNLFPVEAERAIRQHFTLDETLSSPDGLAFRVYRYAEPTTANAAEGQT